ncbi:hypothetical protein [Deinococcus maricopensis]|uniref:Desiccation-associated late embryogenesis abundant protein n=1 Tax=Deinococcus maricopensis (strain DSM 21211 / LMG 22137 / NRRL B-23946 / LB-34) TaxID=709986 RepID=E8U769_DEIML|nr:hypothetical protein [Deinococcus maricopensis]ADV66908.1 hypothetical protein Deima_1257 [Deinococcus maricopensis DSM 21211]
MTHDRRSIPTLRLLLLGALLGAAAYYLGREQTRAALNAKMDELGLRDAARNATAQVREAAQQAGATIAEKAGDVRDAAAHSLEQLRDTRADDTEKTPAQLEKQAAQRVSGHVDVPDAPAEAKLKA